MAKLALRNCLVGGPGGGKPALAALSGPAAATLYRPGNRRWRRGRFSICEALFRIGAEGLQPVWVPEPRPLEEMACPAEIQGQNQRNLYPLPAQPGGGFRRLPGRGGAAGTGSGLLLGTGLFVAAAQGYAALGIERDKKAVQELHAFLKRYFTYHPQARGGAYPLHQGGQARRRRHPLCFRNRRTLESGERQELLYVRGDAAEAEAFFRRGTVQAVFGDLPYGVQHAGHEGGAAVPPAQPLRRALPAGSGFCAPGGAVALAFNSHTLKRQQVWEEMAAAGSSPYAAPPTITWSTLWSRRSCGMWRWAASPRGNNFRISA